MKGKDEIQNLFSDKLGGYEAKVNPELWGKVASQIGAGSAATATGMALTTKLIIGLGAASVLTVASFVAFDSTEDAPVKETAQVEVPKEIIVPVVEEEEQPIVVEFVEPITPVIAPYTVVFPAAVAEPKPFVIAEVHTKFEDNPIPNGFTPEDQLKAPKSDTSEVNSPDEKPAEPQVVDPVVSNVPAEDIITKESTEIDLVFPNIFTPNGDGTNDYLFISNTESLQKEGFLVRIINSNYKEVFMSSEPNFKWDGRDLGGEDLPNGYYIAFVTCKDSDGHEAKPVMFQFEIRK